MEERSMSLINYFPEFIRRGHILLIHNVKMSLFCLSTMLQQYSFKVTYTQDISEAASMISNHKDKFKLIMVKDNMNDMNSLSFLELAMLNNKDIQVIFISSGELADETRKALETKPCYILEEQIIYSNDLRYLWQQSFNSKGYPCQQIENVEDSNEKGYPCQQIENVEDSNDNHYAERRLEDDTITKQVYGVNGKRNDGNDKGSRMEEKRRVDEYRHTRAQKEEMWCERGRVWTLQLHQKFVEAVSALGENRARPKKILAHMKEPSITARQIASHLQKYRAQMRGRNNVRNFDQCYQPLTELFNGIEKMLDDDSDCVGHGAELDEYCEMLKNYI